jgi:ABC-type lipoprotein release transport system permease subunit
MLVGLKPTDPFTLTGAALLLFAIAMLAGWIPARRASLIQPMQALRHARTTPVSAPGAPR